MNFKRSWLTSRKIRVDILTIFAILMISVSSIIISYSYIKSSSLILSLGADLIKKSTQHVITQLNEFIRPSVFIDVANLILSDKKIDKEEQQKLGNFMHIILATQPQLSSIYIADINNTLFSESRVYHDPDIEWGTYFLLKKDMPPGTEFVSEIVEPENGHMFLTNLFKDIHGNVIGKKEHVPINYHPNLEPWYLGALKNIKKSWISLTTAKNVPKELMSVSQKVVIRNEVAGVLTVDVHIDAIRRYLEDYKISQNSIAFIADHSGKVITTLQQPISKNGNLPSIYDLHDNRLITAYRIFLESHKNQFTFKLNDVEYLALFTPYALFEKNIWEIGTIVPADDFIGVSKEQHQRILLFSFIMLLIGLLLALLLSHRISKPIMQLAKETQSIKKLDFKQTSRIDTHIYEIQVLSDAFNTAKNALSSFVKYIPKEIVAKLMSLGTIAQTGGVRREMSILFSDIHNFTPIAESMPPEELMQHMTDYFNTLTTVIHHYYGNIDKFIGDAVMAFWGAPLDDPEQTKHCCLAALSCRYHLKKINKEWKKIGKPVFHTRFGINTGIAVVGNMGSSDRLNYTAIGDEINLTARLEQINKVYGTHIIASESIYQACHEEFLFRPIDIVKVRGKKKTTPIYELVAAKFGPTELIATSAQIELCNLTWSAYEAYQNQEIERATTLFTEIIQKFPKDPLAEYYLKKINEV